MPNWCSNKLTIEAEPAVVDGMVDYIKNNNGWFFNYLRPMPSYLNDRVHNCNGKEHTWYDWRSDNWGCKWDACDTAIVDVSSDDDGMKSVTVLFESPWAPPIYLYNFLHSIDVGVKATYSEPMMGFEGTYENGVDTEFSTFSEEAS